MFANYHTHTFRCGHASGTEREYIERAIANGITKMGFSDHSPYAFSNGHVSSHRVPMDQVADYFETISKLRDEYRDRIDIKIGFEMEYYPYFFKDMLKTVVDAGAEYLILGEHYYGNETPEIDPYGKPTESVDILRSYVSDVCAGMASGAFTYLAHPDYIRFTGDEDIFLSEMRKVCRASNEYGVPLELNFLGIRHKRHYPRESFWHLAGEEGCEVVFGFDAHAAVDAYDGESLKIAEDTVKKHGLRLNEDPVLKDPKLALDRILST